VWAYFDTSALVKRYVVEPGRREVQQLLRRHDCVTSAILPVELRSALRRRVAERTLDGSHVSELLKRVVADRPYWTVIEVGTEVLRGAEALVSAHPLRTLDAIHVASAQLFAARLSIADLIFVSADKRQVEAASAIGLTTRHIG
jgi:uncharacterized protein